MEVLAVSDLRKTMLLCLTEVFYELCCKISSCQARVERCWFDSTLFLMESPAFVPRRRKYFCISLQNNMFLHLLAFDTHQKTFTGRKTITSSSWKCSETASGRVLGVWSAAEPPCFCKLVSIRISGKNNKKKNNKRGWAGAVRCRDLAAAPTSHPEGAIDPVTNGGFKEESVPDQYAIHSTWITPAFPIYSPPNPMDEQKINTQPGWGGWGRQVGRQNLIRGN